MNTSLLGRATDYVGLISDAVRLRRAAQPEVAARARAHLAQRMGRLRGLPQKVGQILSMAAGDEAVADAFAGLCDAAAPLSLDDLRPTLEAAWGRPVPEICTTIEPVGLAASLGQVHRATLRDGRDVAIKIQYPGIRAAVLADLRALGWLATPISWRQRHFDLGAYRELILHDIDRELDYRGEAARQSDFLTRLRLPDWRVPRVVTELSGESVLVSEWLSGATIDDAANWPHPQRTELSRRLLAGALEQLFRHGVFHADPNPGNYRFRNDSGTPEIVLYDFGCVAELTRPARLALLRLIEMTRQNRGAPFDEFVALGFDAALLAPLRGKLPALLRVLFEPFTQEGPYDLTRWRRGPRAADILGDDRWNFRMSGPPALIFFLRALSGLCFYLQRLAAPVSWSAALTPILRDFSAELAAPRPASSRDPAASAARSHTRHDHAADTSNTALPSADRGFAALAQHLKINVSENGRTKVALTLPASAIDDLDELIDDDVRRRILAANVDLDECARAARRRGYAPQMVFELPAAGNGRGVRVWLE